jgi:hypothetical protein
MGTEPLPPGVYPIADDKYIISLKKNWSEDQLFWDFSLFFPVSTGKFQESTVN